MPILKEDSYLYQYYCTTCISRVASYLMLFYVFNTVQVVLNFFFFKTSFKAWEYFILYNNTESAQGLKCNAVFTCKGFSTNRHLRQMNNAHNELTASEHNNTGRETNKKCI